LILFGFRGKDKRSVQHKAQQAGGHGKQRPAEVPVELKMLEYREEKLIEKRQNKVDQTEFPNQFIVSILKHDAPITVEVKTNSYYCAHHNHTCGIGQTGPY
jgi:hypothetical protein